MTKLKLTEAAPSFVLQCIVGNSVTNAFYDSSCDDANGLLTLKVLVATIDALGHFETG